jgi:hypothetical protein
MGVKFGLHPKKRAQIDGVSEESAGKIFGSDLRERK